MKARASILGRPPGVVLIMVAAVLAVLAALATGFYTMTLSQSVSAIRYSDNVRAQMMAQAGVAYGISSMRAQAFSKPEDANDPWFTTDYMHGVAKTISFAQKSTVAPFPDLSYSQTLGDSAGAQSDRFTLRVSDAASRINVNACDNLAVVMDNLCRVIGPPLVAADLDAIQPARWGQEMFAGDPLMASFNNGNNTNDTLLNRDYYYWLYDATGTVVWQNGDWIAGATAQQKQQARPFTATPNGPAMYGDGYAIAGYRGWHGAYSTINDVKKALTYVERNGNGIPDLDMEQLEIEVKFAAIRDYITTSSWVDTNTVCVGKFEWVHVDTGSGKTYAIDRDKSWIVDDPTNDPLNLRGSLRGSYVSIVNGHGSGQLRRIRTNGIDWIEVESGFAVTPGPSTSYMIVANEDALLVDATNKPLANNYPDNPPAAGTLSFPMTNPDGTLAHNPKIDYAHFPLCIHRAPVNVNTASDKVLAALLLGVNVMHGHPLSMGTDADPSLTRAKWKTSNPPNTAANYINTQVQPYILTPAGMKRLPAVTGKPVYNATAPVPPAATGYDMNYINNYGTINASNYGIADPIAETNPVQKLVYRILIARQTDANPTNYPYFDPLTGDPQSAGGYTRGPFKTWDDLYFRVIKPFDDEYFKAGVVGGVYHHAHIARMLMANFNSNTDILKFNPNIEWIDRFGRNFTQQEAVMVYTNSPMPHSTNVPPADPLTASSIPIYTTMDNNLKSSQRWPNPLPTASPGYPTPSANWFIQGAYVTRTYRYKSDEMIDKTDLNRSTTELAFDSGGIFDIDSVGQVASAGNVLAEREVRALVKVYDVWRETTQQQFVQGKISQAVGALGSGASGQIARDAYPGKPVIPNNSNGRLALTTLPEPLVPLKYRIADQNGNPNPNNAEIVTTGGAPLDAYGKVRSNPYDAAAPAIQVPDVIANHIQPARYDGQIVLATNTAGFDSSSGGDADTFLASFDGDMDTATCMANGREQAKTPLDGNVRVVDTIGLLGALNDTNLDMDPAVPMYNPADPVNGWRWVYDFNGMNSALQPLNPGPDPDQPYYWNNMSVRMGDLRTDGVYLGSPGISGNDATLKYLYGNPAVLNHGGPNFDPGSPSGSTVSMWAKPVWRHDDMRHHEFINMSNDGVQNTTRGCYIAKYGQYSYCIVDQNEGIGHSGNRTKINDFMCFWETNSDYDFGSLIHGGAAYVNTSIAKLPESPGFRVQPFRWCFVGGRRNVFSKQTDTEGDGPRGHWVPNYASPPSGSSADYNNPKNVTVTNYKVRPFIDTQLEPEGISWSYHFLWSFRTTNSAPVPYTDIGNTGTMDGNGDFGQDVKWDWADPPGPNRVKCWGMNNLNYGTSPVGLDTTASPSLLNSTNTYWHYRMVPEDGTFAVIDELKISSKDRVLNNTPDWANDRIAGTNRIDAAGNKLPPEMFTSRYYLAPNATTQSDPLKGGPPTFTSQTMLQSRQGFDKTTGGEEVTVLRVNWNAFTPRFMSEYNYIGSTAGNFSRKENVSFPSPPPAFYTYPLVAPAPVAPVPAATPAASPTGNVTLVQTQPSMYFKGPFDFVKYNDIAVDNLGSGFTPAILDGNPCDYSNPIYDNNAAVFPYRVGRIPPEKYTGQPQYSKGVEVELLKDNGVETLLAPVFTDPNQLNALGTQNAPVKVFTHQLRYRVRFKYPVDRLADPNGGIQFGTDYWTNPAKQYLLDTPVFDDISVTYMIQPQILTFQEVTE